MDTKQFYGFKIKLSGGWWCTSGAKFTHFSGGGNFFFTVAEPQESPDSEIRGINNDCISNINTPSLRCDSFKS